MLHISAHTTESPVFSDKIKVVPTHPITAYGGQKLQPHSFLIPRQRYKELSGQPDALDAVPMEQ
jgi:hypothetical protein